MLVVRVDGSGSLSRALTPLPRCLRPKRGRSFWPRALLLVPGVFADVKDPPSRWQNTRHGVSRYAGDPIKFCSLVERLVLFMVMCHARQCELV